MNILDENIPLDQRDLLNGWGIHCRMVGQDIARPSVGDDNILALLHRLKQPTFFTRDEDFFNRRLCHSAYGLVFLDIAPGTYLALGGSLDPEPDTQSPFFDARAPRPRSAHGRTGVRVLRRGRV